MLPQVYVPDIGAAVARAEAMQGSRLQQLAALRGMEDAQRLRGVLGEVSPALFGADPPAQRSALQRLVAEGGPAAAPLVLQFQGQQAQAADRAADREFRERQLRETMALRQAQMSMGRAPDEFARLLAQAGIQPGTPEAQQFARARLERMGQTGPQVVVNQGDNSYDREIAKEAAGALGVQRNEAQSGIRLVQSAQRVQELLPQAITGAGADARLLFARVGASLGFNDPRKAVEATQTLMAELARGVLAQADSLKGVLSDRDMELLRQAAGGDISLDAAAIGRIATLSESAGRSAVERYNSTLANARLPEAAAAVFRPFDLPPARGAAPPSGASTAQPGQPVRVRTPEEARALPPGTPILLPDGTLGRVPG